MDWFLSGVPSPAFHEDEAEVGHPSLLPTARSTFPSPSLSGAQAVPHRMVRCFFLMNPNGQSFSSVDPWFPIP